MGCDICIYMDCDVDAVWADSEQKIEALPADVKCCECHDVISAGTVLQVMTGWKDEERTPKPEIYYTCLGCSQVRHAYCCGMEVYGGDFWERLFEDTELTEFTMAGECWESLGAAGKQKLQEMWVNEMHARLE